MGERTVRPAHRTAVPTIWCRAYSPAAPVSTASISIWLNPAARQDARGVAVDLAPVEHPAVRALDERLDALGPGASRGGDVFEEEERAARLEHPVHLRDDLCGVVDAAQHERSDDRIGRGVGDVEVLAPQRPDLEVDPVLRGVLAQLGVHGRVRLDADHPHVGAVVPHVDPGTRADLDHGAGEAPDHVRLATTVAGVDLSGGCVEEPRLELAASTSVLEVDRVAFGGHTQVSVRSLTWRRPGGYSSSSWPGLSRYSGMRRCHSRERDPQLAAGEVRAEAAVHAAAERDVAVGVAVEAHLERRRGTRPGRCWRRRSSP